MPLRQLLDCKISGIEVWDINTHFERRLGQMRLDYVKAGWLIFGDGFEQGGGQAEIGKTHSGRRRGGSVFRGHVFFAPQGAWNHAPCRPENSARYEPRRALRDGAHPPVASCERACARQEKDGARAETTGPKGAHGVQRRAV